MDIETATRGVLDARRKAGEILSRKRLDPVALAEQMDRMSLYNTYVGDELGRVSDERENKRAHHYLNGLKQGMSATAAENHARALVAELTGTEKKLKLLHSDVWEYASKIQSRLRGWEQERSRQ